MKNPSLLRLVALALLAIGTVVVCGQETAKPGDGKISAFVEVEGFEGVGAPGGWEVQAGAEDSYSGGALASISEENINKRGNQPEITGRLPQPLPPGEYRVFVRVFQLMLGDEDSVLEVQLNDAPAQRLHWGKMKRMRWQPPLLFKTTQPGQTLKLKAVKAAGFSTGNPEAPDRLVKKIMVDNVLVTNDPAWEVIELHSNQNKIDRPQAVVRKALPPATALKGNYLENSSFEVGRGHGWGNIWIEQLDNSTAVDGQWSVRLPVRPMLIGGDVGWVYQVAPLESKFYRLPPGRYTLSAWVKSDKPTAAGRLTFGLAGHPDDPDKSGPGKEFTVDPGPLGPEWKRLTMTVDVPEAPGNFWSVRFAGRWRMIDQGFKSGMSLEEIAQAGPKVPGAIWIDAIQLEQGDSASEYRTRGGDHIEVGVHCEQPGNILYEDEAPNVRLQVYNAGKSREPIEVQYRIEDYHDQPVAQEKLTIALEGKTHVQQPLAVPLQRRGIFRLLVWRIGDEANKDEMVFSVLPPNKHLKDFYPAGRAGTDTSFEAAKLAVLKRANINWVIHKHLGRMESVQPKLGEDRWSDEQVRQALDAKMTILGQVFVNDPPAYIEPYTGTPAGWDPEKKKKYLEIWGDFVFRLVSHYKDQIRYWEVTNEPYFWCTAQDLADVTRVASEAIRRVDPGIHIVAFCSANQPGFFQRALRAADPQWYDGMSGHYYNSDPRILRPLAAALAKYHKTGWQTEAGPTFPSFYVTLPTLQQLYGDEHFANPASQTMRDNFALSIQGELRCYGIGAIDHYFHYFSRFGNASPSETTRRAGGGKEDVEYDGSLRPYAVARSIASYFLDGATPHGEWRGDTRLTVCLFEKDGGTVGFAWSTDGRILELSPQSSTAWQVFDWFGNSVPSSDNGTIQLDRFPKYFKVAALPQQVAQWLDRSKVSGGVNLDARLTSTAGGGHVLALLLANESQQPQSVALTLEGALASQISEPEKVAQVALAPAEQRIIELPLLRLPAYHGVSIHTRGERFTIKSTFAFALADARRVGALDDLRPGQSPAEPFKYDLIRAGAGNRMSPADFTPAFQAGYDQQNLYLAADIVDDQLSPTTDKIPAGQNDQVHFLIAAPTPQRRSAQDARERFARKPSTSDRVIVLAPAENGSAVGDLRHPGEVGEPIAGVTFQKTEAGYRLAAAIAWEKLGMAAPQPGDSVAFNVVAFDADGVNADHKTEWPWAGGPDFRYEDPAGWGELVFRQD